jgi:hypothetical protein
MSIISQNGLKRYLIFWLIYIGIVRGNLSDMFRASRFGKKTYDFDSLMRNT